jgi:hypothetical protein
MWIAPTVYSLCWNLRVGLRIKETKEVYEGEVTELTPCETENPLGGKNVCSVFYMFCCSSWARFLMIYFLAIL